MSFCGILSMEGLFCRSVLVFFVIFSFRTSASISYHLVREFAFLMFAQLE